MENFSEIIIIGAGICGLSTAMSLVERNKKIQVIDSIDGPANKM